MRKEINKKKLDKLKNEEIIQLLKISNLKPKKSKKDNIDLLYNHLNKIYLNKKKLSGAGIIDTITQPIKNIYSAVMPITSLNNISTRTLEQYGNYPIQEITIARTPLNAMLEGVINVASFNKFEELKKKFGFDNLFHLSLICKVVFKGGFKNIVVEKNEVINIEPLDQNNSTNNKTQYLKMIPPIRTNLNSMIKRTENFMGSDFLTYNSFFNNCQHFVSSFLDSNQMLNIKTKNFILQDVGKIKSGLDDSGFGFVPKAMNVITDIGSRFSRLIGNGDKDEKEFKNFIIKYKFRGGKKYSLKKLEKEYLNAQKKI